jgi:hypothetical protein
MDGCTRRWGSETAAGKSQAQEQTRPDRPEKNDACEAEVDVRGEAIAGASCARWSDNFRASGLVYPSALTCALSTHQTAFCSPLQVPMLCIDGASEPDLLCEHPRLRWCTIQWPAGLPRPSFTMAAVGRIAASMRNVQVPAQGALVRDFSRTSSTSSGSAIILNQGPRLPASQGAWQPPRLEHSDPLAQPPLDHVLTWALSYPHTLTGRSMVAAFASDGRSLTGSRVVGTLPRPLTPPPALRSGASSEVRLCGSYAYVHAPDRLLSLPNSLRRPRHGTNLA